MVVGLVVVVGERGERGEGEGEEERLGVRRGRRW